LTSRQLLPLREYAFHEAGHCVIAHLEGAEIRFATLHVSGGAGGVTGWVAPERLEGVARICAAGSVAKHRYDSEPSPDLELLLQEDRGDRETLEAIACCRGVREPSELDALWQQALRGVRATLEVDSNWRCVTAVAEALLDNKCLNGDEIERIIGDAD
jgi:hypothetical protein